MKRKNNSAITLIALIITIIVLLILAGVTIQLIIGNNGLFHLASIAGKNYIEAENKELNELDKLFSSILVAQDSKVTLTMQELDEYIKQKMDSTVQELNTTITNLEQAINELKNPTYTYKKLASTTSTTIDNAVSLSDKLSNYRYIWIVYQPASGNHHGSGMIPVDVFKSVGVYCGGNNGGGYIALAKYKSDNDMYLYWSGGSASPGTAIVYGIK